MVGGVLPICRGAVSVFHCTNRLSCSVHWICLYDKPEKILNSHITLFENEPELICWHIVKWFLVLLSNSKFDVICYLSDFKYCCFAILLERAAAGIGLYVNAHKTEYMCYNQTGDLSSQDGIPLKLLDKFTYLGSSVSSTEKDIDTRLTKAWTAINRLSIIWKSDLTDKMKHSFFQAAVTLILLYGCITWTLTAGEEAKRQLHKNAASNLEQVLAATPHKTRTVRPPASYHENYSS